MDKWTLRFHSKSLELKFNASKVEFLLQVHKLETIIYAAINLAQTIHWLINPGQTINLAIPLVTIFLKVCQHLYVVRLNKQYLSISIAVSNIYLALLDMEALLYDTRLDYMDNYIRASTITIYHFCLLCQPDFPHCFLTLASIAIIKAITTNIEGFHYRSVENFASYVLYLYILFNRSRE